MNGYGFDGRYEAKFMPVELGQTIIKMCYSYAVAELGLGSFEPVCLPQVLSINKNISYIFGQKGVTKPDGGESIVWKIELAYIIGLGTPLILTPQATFLEKMGMPIYEVILGVISKPDQFAIMGDKVANYSLIEQL